jgi:hypothetical protein
MGMVPADIVITFYVAATFDTAPVRFLSLWTWWAKVTGLAIVMSCGIVFVVAVFGSVSFVTHEHTVCATLSGFVKALHPSILYFNEFLAFDWWIDWWLGWDTDGVSLYYPLVVSTFQTTFTVFGFVSVVTFQITVLFLAVPFSIFDVGSVIIIALEASIWASTWVVMGCVDSTAMIFGDFGVVLPVSALGSVANSITTCFNGSITFKSAIFTLGIVDANPFSIFDSGELGFIALIIALAWTIDVTSPSASALLVTHTGHDLFCLIFATHNNTGKSFAVFGVDDGTVPSSVAVNVWKVIL